MRVAGDEAIFCNKEQIAALAMTIEDGQIDITILQSCDVGCYRLKA
ncbi:MAG: hypothetical protein ACK5IQ_11310 [Bacteroidales bacterium]